MEPHDPIHPEEVLLRRVFEAQMNSGPPISLSTNAFDPHKDRDSDGLSVYRRAFHTPQEAANFRNRLSKSKAWVVELRASAITALGITVDPKPLEATPERPAQPGHAVLRELNSANRKSEQADQWKQKLLSAVTNMTGPYEAP